MTNDADRAVTRREVATAGVVFGLAGCLESTEGGPYDGFLATANNFDDVVDRTGQSEVSVSVGAGERGLAFGPAAVQVSPDTTVVWEWTGTGGRHNVVHENGAFESELFVSEGQTFTHSFADPGVFKYVCEPHETQGMLGVVEVVEN